MMQNGESRTSEFDWRVTSFEWARREQLRRWVQLSLEDVTRAIEEIQNITQQLGGTASR